MRSELRLPGGQAWRKARDGLVGMFEDIDRLTMLSVADWTEQDMLLAQAALCYTSSLRSAFMGRVTMIERLCSITFIDAATGDEIQACSFGAITVPIPDVGEQVILELSDEQADNYDFQSFTVVRRVFEYFNGRERAHIPGPRVTAYREVTGVRLYVQPVTAVEQNDGDA